MNQKSGGHDGKRVCGGAVAILSRRRPHTFPNTTPHRESPGVVCMLGFWGEAPKLVQSIKRESLLGPHSASCGGYGG